MRREFFFRCLFDSRRGNCGIAAMIRISPLRYGEQGHFRITAANHCIFCSSLIRSICNYELRELRWQHSIRIALLRLNALVIIMPDARPPQGDGTVCRVGKGVPTRKHTAWASLRSAYPCLYVTNRMSGRVCKAAPHHALAAPVRSCTKAPCCNHVARSGFFACLRRRQSFARRDGSTVFGRALARPPWTRREPVRPS